MSGKLSILAVGTFDADGNPVGWMFGGPEFGGDEDVAGLSLNEISTGHFRGLWGGYTAEELREIAEEAA